MTTSRLLAQGGLIVLTLLAGCRPGPAPLTPVQGKVTYKGVPVTRGTIVFTPDSSRGGDGKIAVAKIDADGTYSLKTGDAPGASPGSYRVTLVSLASSDAPGASERFKAPLSLLPEKYCDPELSELRAQVKGGKTNVLDFELN